MIFIASANCLRPISNDSSVLWRRKTYYFFTYQPQNINVSEWLSIFTLCLAPLVTHTLVGAPDLVVLRNPQPRWTDRVCHFNLTSIYWRYYVITCRRVCSMNWNSADMASSNAAFWTGCDSKGDGSETMMLKSRAFCTKSPRNQEYLYYPLLPCKQSLSSYRERKLLMTLSEGSTMGNML